LLLPPRSALNTVQVGLSSSLQHDIHANLHNNLSTKDVGIVSATQYSDIHFQDYLIWLVSGKHSLADIYS